MNKKINLDNTDKEILAILMKDAKMPYTDAKIRHHQCTSINAPPLTWRKPNSYFNP